jgi:hypothetical protein
MFALPTYILIVLFMNVSIAQGHPIVCVPTLTYALSNLVLLINF